MRETLSKKFSNGGNTFSTTANWGFNFGTHFCLSPLLIRVGHFQTAGKYNQCDLINKPNVPINWDIGGGLININIRAQKG